MKRIRVLVVDDSSTMRGLIATALSSDAEIEVVGQAEDPLQARQAIKALNPDVVTLDVEMPNMSGLEFLEKIMRLRPMPVIMVSTLTSRGAEETVRALEIGAVDCIEKPRPGNEHNFEELPFKVKIAAMARVRPLTTESERQKNAVEARSAHGQYASDGRVLAIGASTGGVEALIELLSHFPENCPPTVIAQHMPASFTKSFANRLNRLCPAQVQEATVVGERRDETMCQAATADMTCELQSETCVDSDPQTRIVGGLPVTRACWNWQRNYSCHRFSQANDCSALEGNQQCTYLRTDCLDDPQAGPCKVSEKVYRCPIPQGSTATDKQYICGNDVYCINGDCEPIVREASTEFKDALVALHGDGHGLLNGLRIAQFANGGVHLRSCPYIRRG